MVVVLALAGCGGHTDPPGPGAGGADSGMADAEQAPTADTGAGPPDAQAPDVAPLPDAPRADAGVALDGPGKMDVAPACAQAGEACGRCCAGTTCVNFPSVGDLCAANCTTGAECQSGCCAKLQGGGSACYLASGCSTTPPAGGLTVGTYKVTVSRDSSDLYKVVVGAKLFIKTQFCFEFVYFDDATLVWGGKFSPDNRITFSTKQSCTVVDVLAGQ